SCYPSIQHRCRLGHENDRGPIPHQSAQHVRSPRTPGTADPSPARLGRSYRTRWHRAYPLHQRSPPLLRSTDPGDHGLQHPPHEDHHRLVPKWLQHHLAHCCGIHRYCEHRETGPPFPRSQLVHPARVSASPDRSPMSCLNNHTTHYLHSSKRSRYGENSPYRDPLSNHVASQYLDDSTDILRREDIMAARQEMNAESATGVVTPIKQRIQPYRSVIVAHDGSDRDIQ